MLFDPPSGSIRSNSLKSTGFDDGIPYLAVASSRRSEPARTIGAEQSGNTPGIGGQVAHECESNDG
jgi:hypothetical protein